MNTKPIIIGVAGGTGSGKTTVSREILNRVGRERISYIQHDSYYKDRSHLPLAERARVNFDHPDSLETELLVEHLRQLLADQPIEVPVYDFTTHTRTTETRTVYPKSVVLVEGILIFVDRALRDLLAVKIFVDTDADIRFIRRLKRDIAERGRTLESVLQQYLNTVRPMHLEFVEPSKRYADVIIPEGGFNVVALDMVVARVEATVEDTRMERHSSKTIVVFGGSRVAVDSPRYQEALDLGRLLAESGFTVMTGGYNGTMEAANRGAKEAGGRSIGVKSAVFDPLPTNDWLDEEVNAPDLFSRLNILITQADAYIVLQGSMGTLAELALAWNMRRIQPVPSKPIILVGRGWRRAMGVLIQELNISQHELGWLHIVETPEEAVTTLHQQCPEVRSQE